MLATSRPDWTPRQLRLFADLGAEMHARNAIAEAEQWMAARAIALSVDAPETALRAVILESGLVESRAEATRWALRCLARINRPAAIRVYELYLGTRYYGTHCHADVEREFSAAVAAARGAS